MVFPERSSRQGAPRDSLNYMLGNFIAYCKECDFNDQEWLENHSETIESEFVLESNFYLKKLARALGIRLSTRKSS
jgi:hypothetical protein